jgi:PAS domain S-box-containing protein
MCQSVHGLLLRNDPLDAVWRESERGLDFVRKAGFRDIADNIVTKQRFIATMQGRTATFSTFSDSQFDEAAFEAQLTEDRIPPMVCFYWIVKLKARFLSGNYAEALTAAGKAKPLLWASTGHVQLLDYFYYAALTVAALYEKASANEQTGWCGLLTANREQLREWADNYPPTFGDKHALVSAELARIEGRDLDAMRLYEEAIRAARENGFVQNEGIANELAAQFYLKRGIEKVAHSYLRDARYCFLRWGALGKVKQLDERYPAIEEQASVRPTTTIGTSVEQLDLGTVMKASQAVAGEIVLEKLIKTLMMIAVEHAGAERGLLILPRGEELRIVAEARTGRDGVEVQLQDALVTTSDLADSLLHYVIRTQESVILDDASSQNLFSQDEYVRQRRPRSVLCLPLLKQVHLVGILYLENSLAPRVFTPKQLAMLEMLSSQAAISLDHARLYAGLRQENSDRRKAEEALRASEERWRKLFETSSAGIALGTTDGCFIAANLALQKMLGYTEEELQGLTLFDLNLEEDRTAIESRLAELAEGQRRDFEKRYRCKDGNVIWADISSAVVPATGRTPALFAFVVVDITERKRAEEALQKAQTELAHVSRVTTMGELAASVAHEVNQPLGAITNNANACLRLLATGSENLQELEGALSDIVKGVDRVNGIIVRMRALAKKVPPEMARLDLEDVVTDVLTLIHHELTRRHVAIHTELSKDLPPILADRIQLQQVLLNLVMNGIEAMNEVAEAERKISILARRHELNGRRAVLVSVQDSGVGLKPGEVDRLFEAFYTTKAHGIGMGLAISRSIVEAHGGRLWVAPADGPGATFEFILPAES